MKLPFDLPESAKHVTDALPTTHHVVEFTPNDDRSLAYRLVLPKGWKAESQLPPARVGFAQPQTIGLFAPQALPDVPFVAVTMSRPRVEVNIEDWVDFLCSQDGWEVFSTNWRKTPRGLIVDTGAVKGTRPKREVMRVMAMVDGGRIFMTSGLCTETLWDKYKDDLLVALASFELVSPSREDALEPFVQWEGGDPGFGVAFPASWRAEEKKRAPSGKSGVDIRLIQDNELLAYISVKATSLDAHAGASNARLRQEAEHELTSAGFKATGELAALAHDVLRASVPGYEATYVGEGRMWDREVEIRIGLRLVPGLAFSVSSISVRQEQNPLLWMRSKRAFELACQLNWKRGAVNATPTVH